MRAAAITCIPNGRRWEHYNIFKLIPAIKGILYMNFIGELAALATAVFFAITALIFTSTGRLVGSLVTNRMRLLFALAYLIVLNLIAFHEPLPFSADSSRWL